MAISIVKKPWRQVKGYPNYEVHFLGLVRSKNTGNVMVPWESRRRGGETDMRVSLYTKGKKKNFRVHRLVASAFIPNPLKLPEVDHKNGFSHYNYVGNLEWVSSSENQRRKRLRLAKKR